MRVEINLPDTKASSLDDSIQRQFADLQRQLMGLLKAQNAKDDWRQELLSAMKMQQTSLVDALERLMKTIGDKTEKPSEDAALADALQGLKQVVADLPTDLQSALSNQAQSFKDALPKAQKVSVTMPEGILQKLDSLEAAVLASSSRSRNRTFGSNY